MWIVLGAGAALRFVIALLPERLLLRLTWDDAFYYIRVAQNVAAGAGSSFDGTHATNGYHPLWLLMIAPVTSVVHGVTLIRVLVLIQATISLFTAVLAIKLLRPRIGTPALTVGLAIWWLNPLSVTTSIAGLETALACFAVVLVIAAGFAYLEHPSARSGVLLGVSIGVAFLARSDSVFASAAIVLWVTTRICRKGDTNWVRLGEHLGLGATTAALFALPWFIWSKLNFGTVQQASSGARPMVLWDIAERSGLTSASTASKVLYGAKSAGDYLVQTNLWLGWPATLVLAGALAALIIATRAKKRDSEVVTDAGSGEPTLVVSLGWALLIAGALLAVVHAGLRISPRWYYFEWVRLGMGILGAGIAARFVREGLFGDPDMSDQRVASRRRACVVAALVLAVLASVSTARSTIEPEFRWHSTMKAAGEWLRDNTAPDDRVVSFNAGFISYFSDREVVNLDGVINNSALDALRARDLARYICSVGADWYADFDPVMLDEHAGFMGRGSAKLELEPVKRFSAKEFPTYRDSQMVIQRVRCSG